MLGTGMLVAGIPIFAWNQSLNAKALRGENPAADAENDEDPPSP